MRDQNRAQLYKEAAIRILLTIGLITLIAATSIWTERVYTSIGTMFVLGIATLSTVISWATFGWRAFMRRHAANHGDPKPVFQRSDWRSNWMWDTVTAFMLAAAVALLLLGVI